MKEEGVRIGCYSAFWGDSVSAAAQFFTMDNPPEFVVADYLAEVTMGILSKSKRNAKGGAGKGGFVQEFVDQVYAPNAIHIATKKIRVITNAGGLDPLALKAAIEKTAAAAGVLPLPKVAAVFGDDLMTPENLKKLQDLKKSGEMTAFSHIEGNDVDAEKWPEDEASILSLNAYMGSEPIAEALNAGCDIIVTGRVVDSALVLGPLIHKFKWPMDAYDLLAAGSLAGHVIECGCHATGGNFTDWKLSAFSEFGGWANMGYPIVEVFKNGEFLVSKVPKTGGLVSFGTVSEQIIYEVLDPGSYILPDVIADLRMVQVTEVGKDLVRVTGVKGRAPPSSLKTSGVSGDGYKITGELMIGGAEARSKAEMVGKSIIAKVNGILRKLKMEKFRSVQVECLGAEHTYGPHSSAGNTREVVLRITAIHSAKVPLLLFAREMAPAATCMSPGITGSGSGRPSPSANLSHFSTLIPKSSFPAYYVAGGEQTPVKVPYRIANEIHPTAATKSGDKGDTCNIGIIARSAEIYPIIAAQLTADVVKTYMAHLVEGNVFRFVLPGMHALNFVCTKALGGGGLASTRVDRQGKTYAQLLLNMQLDVPPNILAASAKM
ncbi:hypothetical protein BC829DRAFT_438630 [Chytridium lagenaria]|nr:hypothetical protein BC829DRAFT_438630 [Chytridium lagenaria]